MRGDSGFRRNDDAPRVGVEPTAGAYLPPLRGRRAEPGFAERETAGAAKRGVRAGRIPISSSPRRKPGSIQRFGTLTGHPVVSGVRRNDDVALGGTEPTAASGALLLSLLDIGAQHSIHPPLVSRALALEIVEHVLVNTDRDSID
jgi:hypothetical protein